MLGAAAPAYAQETAELRPLDSWEVVLIIVGLAALLLIGFVYSARGRGNSRDEE
jgi:hypothetical protein